MRLFLVWFCLVFSLSGLCLNAKAQVRFSAPLDFPEAGWNKLLLARNGNTLLFHLIPRRAIEVQVYDSLGARIATTKWDGKEFDVNALPRTSFEGLFSCGDEAVLFLEQEWYGKASLFRLRFNTVTGKLIEEARFAKGKGGMVLNRGNGYAFVFLSGVGGPERTDHIAIEVYDSTHTQVRKAGLGWTTEKDLKELELEATYFLDAHADPEGGVFFTAVCRGGGRRLAEGRSTKIHLVHVRMGWDDSTLLHKVSDVQEDLLPHYELMSWDPVSNTDRHLLITSIPVVVQGVADKFTDRLYQGNYIVRRHEDLSPLGRRLFMPEDTTILRTDAAHQDMHGVPVHMFRGQDGTCVIFSEASSHEPIRSEGAWYYNNYLRNVSVQGLRANGKAAWEVMVPKQQVAFVPPGSAHSLHGSRRLPGIGTWDMSYNSLASFDALPGGPGRWFVIYNQPQPEIVGKDRPPILDLRKSTAMLSVVGEDGSLETRPLYKTSESDGTTVSALLDSGSFDLSRGLYAVLVLCPEGSGRKTKVVWCSLPVAGL